jgi:hypothetical protein
MQNMLICKICKICIYLYCFAYCTYFAYEIYIAQLHLIWSAREDAVNRGKTNISPFSDFSFSDFFVRV